MAASRQQVLINIKECCDFRNSSDVLGCQQAPSSRAAWSRRRLSTCLGSSGGFLDGGWEGKFGFSEGRGSMQPQEARMLGWREDGRRS